MTIRLYFDEDSMSQALVTALRARAVDVVTALECQMIGRPDGDHLEIAANLGRVLYSFNTADYFRLHTECLHAGRSHSGLILSRQQTYTTGTQLRRLLKLISVRSAEEMANRVEFLSMWG